QQQQAYQAFAQAEYQRKRIQVAIRLAKAAVQAYAGNPQALIARLSDKEAREVIEKEIKDKAIKVGGVMVGGAAYTVVAPLLQLISGITSFLSSLGLLGETATGAASAASSAMASSTTV